MASTSGRLAHALSTRLGPISRWYGRRHVRSYEGSRGTRRTRIVSGHEVFRLSVAGRRSGEPRAVMLVLVRDGADLLACGSNAGHPSEPGWSKNLRAAGRAEVRIGADVFDVTAHEPSGTERAKRWQRLVAVYPDFASYQERTERPLPVWVLETVS